MQQFQGSLHTSIQVETIILFLSVLIKVNGMYTSNYSIPYSSSSSSRTGSVREEVTVHEVVFGPLGDGKAFNSGVYLYFNLDVRKVLRSIKTKRTSSSNSAFSNIEALRIHNLDCFSQFTTTDECFYGVVTKILQLRHDILTSCSKTAAPDGILTNDDVMKHSKVLLLSYY